MLWFRASAAIGIGLIFVTFCFGPEAASAASRAGTHETVEKSIPPGQDPPASDDEQRTAPPAEHKGVIPPLRWGMRAFTPKSRTPKLVMRRK